MGRGILLVVLLVVGSACSALAGPCPLVPVVEPQVFGPETTLPRPRPPAPVVITQGLVRDGNLLMELVDGGDVNVWRLLEVEGPDADPMEGREVSTGEVPRGESLAGFPQSIGDLAPRFDAGEVIWVSVVLGDGVASSGVVRLRPLVSGAGVIEGATVAGIVQDEAVCFEEFDYEGAPRTARLFIRGESGIRVSYTFNIASLQAGLGVPMLPPDEFLDPGDLVGEEVVITIEEWVDDPLYGWPVFPGDDGLPFSTAAPVDS